METAGRTFSELVVLVKSWIPWRSEPSHVSRDFWMPDQSCRVCYECDSQFTLFNRRHHCRLCGRIFCAKCTPHWVPTPSRGDSEAPLEEWDTIRVCNFCFKQCSNSSSATIDNGVQVAANLDFSSTTLSAASFISTKSSGTCDSSNSTAFVSLPQSTGLSPYHSPKMETTIDRQSVGTATTTSDNAEDIGGQNRSQTHYGFYPNRSDDDDDEYGLSHFNSVTSHFSKADGYFSQVSMDDLENDYQAHKNRDALDLESVTSSLLNALDSQASEEVHQNVSKCNSHVNSDEGEATSTLYTEVVDMEPVDFENNGVLWLPPEPEDEEDEREAFLFEDDDEGDGVGEWGYLRNSNSFGSGEYRSREKSNEEHKRAMKNVVDGHFRALVAQLLQVENLLSEEESDKEGWLEIITALSWEAALLLKPDMSRGGQMDPGGYVKVKCLAYGLRSESVVVKGVVCKKNVAHRRMTANIEKPRLLILGGALEYQRVSNALSSFDTLLKQEMDHLKMAVAKIDAHHPDILLVEKSVSRYAQDYLLAKDISLVLNVKQPLLERIARCTGSQIVSSIDHISSQKIGCCDMFHVERFLEEHGAAGQAGKKLVKTLMYFEGCPKPLGCTILLRGANGDELKKVKHVIQYGVFAAYHLALETSFLADEGASLPELPLNTPITVALPKPSPIDRSISTIPGFTIPANERTPGPQSINEPLRSQSVPTSEIRKVAMESIDQNEFTETSKVLSLENSQGIEPLSSLNEPSGPCASVETSLVDVQPLEVKLHEAYALDGTRNYPISNDLGDSSIKFRQGDSGDVDLKIGDSNRSLQRSGTIGGESAEKEEFPPSPSDHQSILVSLSSRCVWKGTVCDRAHPCRIKYYGNSDKPLGRYLRDHLFDQNYICGSCEMPAEAHVQCYTHRQGTLTISVKKLPEILLHGEKDGKIWMWHRCLKCPRANGFPPATRRIVMSDAAWGLSFGKFLELSFSNHAAASRVASCGHSLHRDCLRFYGFGKMVACFRYASIDVHSVYLPPSKLDFNHVNQDWLEKELTEITSRAELIFSEVLNTLRILVEKKSGIGPLSSSMKNTESRRQLGNLEAMLQKEKSEFEESLRNILKMDVKTSQPSIDILELNRIRRQLPFMSYLWDSRLTRVASLENKNPPDTLEVTCSEPLVATEKLLDISTPLVAAKSLNGLDSVDVTEAKPDENHGARNVPNNLPQVVFISDPGNQESLTLSVGINVPYESDPLKSDVTIRRALSDGQTPIGLPDSLEAAWTGENPPSIGKESEVETSFTIGVPEKSNVEDMSTSNVDYDMQDTISWLGMPFDCFYRWVNKNFSETKEELEIIRQYDPIYISSSSDFELQTGARLLLPVGVDETVVPVYDDEPTSIISHALASPDYRTQLSREQETHRDNSESMASLKSLDGSNFTSFNSLDEMMFEPYRSLGSTDESTLSFTSRSSLPLDPISYSKALHARVSFGDDGPLGKVKYTVTCYYAARFEALRMICCPSEVDFIRSLSRCKKWGAQGGKSNVFFAKTLDDRFIIKQVTKTELESFIKFAPEYFKYLSESFEMGSPTCLAKILGIYQVISKHPKGGKETKMDVLVMENLLFGRNVTRLYDLKGSSRSRYNPDSSGSNKVLLDQNLIEAMPTSPIFVGNKAKRKLERAVWNDTAFLGSIDVMDYSLLVGVDEEKQELVLGIIDFMRQYTWDKHLETWVKASGILGGPKNALPTVISPKQYKKRFRKAMTTYFLMVPDQWSPAPIIPSKSQTDLLEENSQNVETMASSS